MSEKFDEIMSNNKFSFLVKTTENIEVVKKIGYDFEIPNTPHFYEINKEIFGIYPKFRMVGKNNIMYAIKVVAVADFPTFKINAIVFYNEPSEIENILSKEDKNSSDFLLLSKLFEIFVNGYGRKVDEKYFEMKFNEVLRILNDAYLSEDFI